MGANLDRRGIESVMSGYDMQVDNGNCIYALFYGKDLKFSYKGPDPEGIGRSMLHDELKGLSQVGSNAIYTLKFYSEVPKNGIITNATPHEGSFNFKVNDTELQPYTGGAYVAGADRDIIGAINDLKYEIAQLKQPATVDPELEPADKWMRLISQAMSIPIVEDLVRGIMKKTGMPLDESYQQQPSALAGATQDEFNEALKTLLAADKDFPDVVVKLARMVINDRKTYDMAKTFLK